MAFGFRQSAAHSGPPTIQVTVSDREVQYRQGDGQPVRTPAAALQALNAASRRPDYAWRMMAEGVAEALPSRLSPVREADAWRRVCLEYHLDDDAQERWTLLTQALAALTRAEQVWHITTHDGGGGRGAPVRVTRTGVAMRQALPTGLAGNITPYCLSLGPQTWIFLPDRLYVRQNGAYQAIEYARLRVKAGRTRFIEEERLPGDAQVVGRQWQSLDRPGRSGTPIAQYGTLELEALSRRRILLHVSSEGAADQCAGLFQAFQHFRRGDGAATPAAADCFRRLDLPPSCTQAEATRQFRRLVMAHHPDRASRNGPASQEQANAKLQEIVQAYKDLKRLRGW